MRKILLGLLTISLSCQNPVEETIKNSKPPELSSVSNVPVATKHQLQHSLILGRDHFTIRTNTTDTLIQYASLQEYIQLHKQELIKQQLNLVTTNNAAYNNVLDVLDQMTINKIKDYKLLRYD